MTATFETLMGIDAQLAAAGEYPLPAFWVEQGQRLYGHPTANTLVARCGRGSVKSGFGSRVAVNEVLFGDFEVPRSEIHYWVDISENKAEALQRLRQYETWLTTLGVRFERRGDEIVLPELRRGFMVRAFQVGKLSGFRALGRRSDELAKCAANQEAADPAAEVLASATAMTVTHIRHRPKELLLSSPVGFTDEHATRFDRGDTAEQLTCFGPTWECNPSISEAQTHALEPDDRIWRREYAAIPQVGLSAAYDFAAVERMFRQPVVAYRRARWERPFMVIDPSGGKKDAFTWAAVARCHPPIPTDAYRGQLILRGDGSVYHEIPGPTGAIQKIEGYPPLRDDFAGERRAFYLMSGIKGIEGRFWDQVPADAVVEQIAVDARRIGAHDVYTDQHSYFALAPYFRSFGLKLIECPFTATSKPFAVETFRRWLREGTFVAEQHAKLRAELHAFAEVITPSGGFSFAARGTGHDDYAILPLMAVLATTEPPPAVRQLTSWEARL